MKNTVMSDIDNSIKALEYYIIDHEEHLIKKNAGDDEWMKLNTYKDTLTNLNYLRSIYGN